jgi:hypothetical protein
MSPRDLEISQTKYVLNAGLRYFVQKNMCIKASLYYGMVSGDDKLTKEPFRNGRNLSFKSPIYEFSALYEYHVVAEKQGRLYKVRGTKGGLAFLVGVYPFLGIGAIYYNPKGFYNGKWHSLRDLSTEGQGIKEGTKPYSSISYCIPMGLGFRYSLNQQMGLGLELGFRKTFTDYIDDVSTVYYDKEEIRKKYSENSPCKNAFLGQILTRARVTDPLLPPSNPPSLPNLLNPCNPSKWKGGVNFSCP